MGWGNRAEGWCAKGGASPQRGEPITMVILLLRSEVWGKKEPGFLTSKQKGRTCSPRANQGNIRRNIRQHLCSRPEGRTSIRSVPSPEGATELSPALQRWVRSIINVQVPEGRPRHSFRESCGRQ